MTKAPTIEDVKRLHLEPGDTLVLSVGDHRLGHEQIDAIFRQMKGEFPDHRVIVLSKSTELMVLSPTEGEGAVPKKLPDMIARAYAIRYRRRLGAR